MRTFITCVVAVGLGGSLGILAQDKKPPEKLSFATKNGNVTFDHAAHVKRANGDCAACHDKLFKQDAKAPLNFKAGLHKTAEAAKNFMRCMPWPGWHGIRVEGQLCQVSREGLSLC